MQDKQQGNRSYVREEEQEGNKEKNIQEKQYLTIQKLARNLAENYAEKFEKEGKNQERKY